MNCAPMSSITLKGSTTQNVDIQLSATSARYNLKIYNALNDVSVKLGEAQTDTERSYETTVSGLSMFQLSGAPLVVRPRERRLGTRAHIATSRNRRKRSLR